MVTVHIFVSSIETGGGCLLPEVDVEEWDASGGIDSLQLRRHLMKVVMTLRHPVVELFQMEAEGIIALPTKVATDDSSMKILFETRQKIHKEGSDTCDWEGMKEVSSFVSHFGSIPEYPPLQVLVGARHCFRSLMQLKTQPLTSILKTYQSELTTPTKSLFHYTRFDWNPPCESWCKTFFFYCSPDTTGPLNLYPLHNEKNLLNTNPCDQGKSDFKPGFICFESLLEEEQPDVLITVNDLLVDLTKVVMDEEWARFCSVCEGHGLKAPSPEYLLDVGLEKAFIPIVYFYPFAPVVGFTYTHDFSSIPEPRTLCFTGPAASKWLRRSTSKDDEMTIGSMLTFSEVCHEDSTDDVTRLNGVPTNVLQDLFISKYCRMAEDTPVGEYLRAHHRKEAVTYIRDRINTMKSDEVRPEITNILQSV